MVQAFHADVKEGWSIFIGGWFTLKFLMGEGFPPHHPHSSTGYR